MVEALSNFTSLFNRRLEGPLQKHLQNVYGCIAASAVVAAVGAALDVNGIFQGGILSTLGSIGLMIMLATSRSSDGKDQGQRFMYLLGFAFCSGLSTGPLIDLVWDMNPAIVVSALMYTGVIFTCFSLSALVAREGKYLALGGPLMSMMSTLILGSIINLFFRSHAIAYIQLLTGLGIMCAFILYDTHLIMEKFRMGDQDYVWHSLTLFIDLLSVFKHILVLLADKEAGSRSNSSSSSNNRRKNR